MHKLHAMGVQKQNDQKVKKVSQILLVCESKVEKYPVC
jgi:hypothetical protein